MRCPYASFSLAFLLFFGYLLYESGIIYKIVKFDEFKMAMKEMLTKTGTWLRGYRVNVFKKTNSDNIVEKSVQIDAAPVPEEPGTAVVKKVPNSDKSNSLEMLQDGFGQLIDKLGGINDHLDEQIAQQRELMGRIAELPHLLQNFPDALTNQKAVIDQLTEQLKMAALKNQQFVETVGEIPIQTGKQTDALVDMSNQLAAAADVDVQLTENFNKFNTQLDKLAQNIEWQTDSILQMNKTFAASDRYLKFVLSKQSRRFVWVYISAMAICTTAIIALLIVFFVIS